MRSNRGVTLIMVASVLAILAALGTGFFTMTVMATRSATRYSDSVRAEMMASAGIQYAIAGLRQNAYKKTEDPTDPWFMVDYMNGARKGISFPDSPLLHNGIDDDNDGTIDNVDEINVDRSKNLPYSKAMGNSVGANSDRFLLGISDAASKININHCDNLAVVLDNLCRVIGPPLVAADLDAIQPRRWAVEMVSQSDPEYGLYATANNTNDTAQNKDLYYQLYDESNNPVTTGSGRPARNSGGYALYGDGYAIAGYRATHGNFANIADIKSALTYVERSSPPDGVPLDSLEQLEIEVKYSAIRDYLTVNSWVDTNTVCVGKFEWINTNVSGQTSIAIDRDKSWIPPAKGDADAFRKDPNGFVNTRGSLLGCMVSIVNGHGSGQLRTIVDNGVDWIQVEPNFAVDPGPISSYMIVPRDPAPYVDAYGSIVTSLPTPLNNSTLLFPQTDDNGNLIANPNIDYSRRPLCIHRAPVNINTASDKVLAALFMGINVQHGHPLSVGMDTDPAATTRAWKVIDPNTNTPIDPHNQEPFILTVKGLKRTPVASGKPLLDRPAPWNSPADDQKFNYINNSGYMGIPNFVISNGMTCNEAHELAYRVIMARTRTLNLPPNTPDPDPTTTDAGDGPFPYNASFPGFNRGPFKSWDDLYFRVIKPWDDIRSGYTIAGKPTIPNSGNPGVTAGLGKSSVARLIMANFNPNTDILKFNPNIEWIDRWGRNFTEMEAVMAFTGNGTLTASSQAIFSSATIPSRVGGPISLGPPWADNGSYLTRSFRYKSDEMIDKTDLNRSTTEFAFDSNGIYEIESTGQVVSPGGNVEAERKVESLVKIYDVWRETTQRQFVHGTIKAGPAAESLFPAVPPDIAGMDVKGSIASGQVARDSINTGSRLPLVTQPEPLVPLKYRIDNTVKDFGGAGVGLPNTDVVDAQKVMRDQYGVQKDPKVPDVVANRILPASYDGQILLATNTLGFDKDGDKDTFLASFNGDLDTDTCLGNGREQAKMPHTPDNAGWPAQGSDGYKFRVVDTCSLLGILNDTLIDNDTDIPTAVYKWPDLSSQIKGLNPANYWENVSLRMGDLRTDGVWLSSPGNAGNEATLKWLFGDAKTACNDSSTPGNAKLNFNPGSSTGNLVTMWLKPAWHHSDHRTHEFFDASNPGSRNQGAECRAFYFKKFGFQVWSNSSAMTGDRVSLNRARCDDMSFTLEGNIGLNQLDDQRDMDLLTFLHGGFNQVNPQYLDSADPRFGDLGAGGSKPAPDNGNYVESPCYRVQPFRWSYLGIRWQFNQTNNCSTGGACHGHWVSTQDGADPANVNIVSKFARPFISTQLDPEQADNQDSGGKLYGSYWSGHGTNGYGHFTQPCDIGDTGNVGYGYGSSGQPVKYKWADPAGVEDPMAKVFTINNLNQDQDTWIYRHVITEGTYGVIDELKISSREQLLAGGNWSKDRGVREQTLSRYYLPPNPSDRDQCPRFLSQTMLQSLKGYTTAPVMDEKILLARVTWSVFTPRFLHENIAPTINRTEHITRDLSSQNSEVHAFRGPFDYDKYNEVYTAKVPANQQVTIFPWGVDRPTPKDYQALQTPQQPQASRGVEVILTNNGTPIPGSSETQPGSGVFTNITDGIFGNPDSINRFADDTGAAVPLASVSTSALRYTVIFRYPVDVLVDPQNSGTADGNNNVWVNPNKEYLLDTPVFDDISITYFVKPRILSYSEITE